MRDLATAAEVSFATPFNLFGSKLAIMRALSAERIERMHERAAAASLPADATDRVLEVVAIAVAVMAEKPQINRTVMGAIGAPGADRGDARERSRALWLSAVGDGRGLAVEHRALGLSILPDELANIFRGVLSFWTAGEIEDGDLLHEARKAAATLLFAFADPSQRAKLAMTLDAVAG